MRAPTSTRSAASSSRPSPAGCPSSARRTSPSSTPTSASRRRRRAGRRRRPDELDRGDRPRDGEGPGRPVPVGRRPGPGGARRRHRRPRWPSRSAPSPRARRRPSTQPQAAAAPAAERPANRQPRNDRARRGCGPSRLPPGAARADRRPARRRRAPARPARRRVAVDAAAVGARAGRRVRWRLGRGAWRCSAAPARRGRRSDRRRIEFVPFTEAERIHRRRAQGLGSNRRGRASSSGPRPGPAREPGRRQQRADRPGGRGPTRGGVSKYARERRGSGSRAYKLHQQATSHARSTATTRCCSRTRSDEPGVGRRPSSTTPSTTAAPAGGRARR